MTIKTPLTKEQKDFAKKYQITEDLLLDAQGEGMTDDIKQIMSATEKAIAYNTKCCTVNSDHNFTTIEGYCVECDTDKIAVALRAYKTGYIYIAGSKKSQLIKVGSTNETKDRIKTLTIATAKNSAQDDLELLFQAKTVNLGQVERLFQQKLSEYKSSSQYEKTGKIQNGGELYRCSYNKAKEVISAIDGEDPFEFTQVSEKRHLLAEYQFKNLRAKTETLS